MTRAILGGVLLSVGLAATTAALGRSGQATDTLAQAQALYGQADYDASLALLDHLAPLPIDDGAVRVDSQVLRVLCLVGLGRDDASREAMASLIEIDPRFSFDRLDVAPRVKAAFLSVRSAHLPGVVRRRFEQARVALARGEAEPAAQEFGLVRDVLDESGLASDLGSALADLRLLASGFHDVALRASPSGRAAAGATSEVEPSLGRAEPGRPVATAGGAKPGRAPVPLDEGVPEWLGTLVPEATTLRATLDVTVDASGRVTSVRVIESTHPDLQRVLVSIAGGWRYNPGAPDSDPGPVVRRAGIVVDGRGPARRP